MKRNKSFLIALAISLLLHVAGLVGPIWLLPNLADLLRAKPGGAPLDVHLVSTVPSPPADKPARKPRAKKRPRTEVAPGLAVVPPKLAEEKVSRDDTAVDVPKETGIADEAAAAEAVVAAPTASSFGLPNFVRITYRVSYGDSDFTVGQAIQEIQHDGTAYSMRSHAQTTGLIGLIRPAQIITTSRGEVRADGLRPNQLMVERRNATDTATFNWDQHVVSMPGGAQVELPPGTQDMLSLFVQLSMIEPQDNAIALPVLTTKVVERHEFVVVGEETVSTGWGDRRALHLRNVQANGIERTDVWLGLEDGRLPIRIRITDRKGDTFVQTAESILTNAEGAF